MTAATATPSQLAQQMLAHQTVPRTFSFTPFLQKTYQHGDTVTAEQARTRRMGREAASAAWFASTGYAAFARKATPCEFLHEYNLRKMPECNLFVRNGYCSNGDECLYLHIDPQSKLPPCPHYDRGFCP